MQRDLEREAERLYRLAGEDASVGAAPVALITALLGPESVRVVDERWLPGGGTLARVGEAWRIYLRRGLAPERARFIALHELSHWALGPSGTEAECDALAAALLVPSQAIRAALADGCRSFRSLARWFGCTQTLAALRVGEVTEEPLVVVAPESVRVRGRAYSWPSQPALRQIAQARLRLPGLRKTLITDEAARAVIVARR